MSYQLVWFKRDLRIDDHAALTKAASLGAVRCIYVIEPQYWKQADVALQHFEFIRESLQDLDQQLRFYGGGVEIHTGELPEVLTKIFLEAPFIGLHSHEETGNHFTHLRDKEVAQWCKKNAVSWFEQPQFGVVRGLKNRNLWQNAWEKHMAQAQHSLHKLHFWRVQTSPLEGMTAPQHLQHNPPLRQRGGRVLALATLESFLQVRSSGYRGGISSPLSAPNVCSRLSTYLTWGCISMREVVQRTRLKIASLPSSAGQQKAGLEAFMSRLHWHCHFIQKLESEPEIEWRNMHRGYDGLREDAFDVARFEALKNAQTGWPMVDACVVMLQQTGWLNFRMRAMLVSTAAYPLWLHWRPVGEWLATQFLDYEPGIHWSQLQMQSGTTGINTTRVYNPIKQAQDHDPRGLFVRKWLPPMRQVPDTWLFEPWKMTPLVQEHVHLKVGTDITVPLVDLPLALKQSKDLLHQRRQQPEVKANKSLIIEKHASRQVLGVKKKTRNIEPATIAQMGFDF